MRLFGSGFGVLRDPRYRRFLFGAISYSVGLWSRGVVGGRVLSDEVGRVSTAVMSASGPGEAGVELAAAEVGPDGR